MIHLAQPIVPAGSDFRFILKFWDGQTDIRTDRQTIFVKIVTCRDRGRPCGSKIILK